MLSLLIKPLIGVASNAITGMIETKKAKQELKITEIKAKGFVALQDLPSYYHNLLYIAISASFGIKGAQGAVKLFKK